MNKLVLFIPLFIASISIATFKMERDAFSIIHNSSDENSCSSQQTTLKRIAPLVFATAFDALEAYRAERQVPHGGRASFIVPLQEPHTGPNGAYAELDKADWPNLDLPPNFPVPKIWKRGFDGNKVIIIAFRGTRPTSFFQDWWVDIEQLIGVRESRYEWASETVKEIKANNPESLIITTGHSLGGGMALYASMVNNVAAITFNAAGLGDHTLLKAVWNPHLNRNMEDYLFDFISQSDGRIDPISALSFTRHSSVPGLKYLVKVKKINRFLDFFTLGLISTVQLHSSDRLISALQNSFVDPGHIESPQCVNVLGPSLGSIESGF